MPNYCDPNNVVLYTNAAIALHNYRSTDEDSMYCPPGFVDGEYGSGNVIAGSWREEGVACRLQPIGSVGGNR